MLRDAASCAQLRENRPQRVSAVAAGVLLVARQFRARAAVGQHQQRVVAEAVRAARRVADHAVEGAARLARDTDTVAAIAGALVGARWGASAVPEHWQRIVHGWPGLTGADLARRGLAVTSSA